MDIYLERLAQLYDPVVLFNRVEFIREKNQFKTDYEI